MKLGPLVAFVLALVVSGCAAVEPLPIQVTDRCTRCKRTIDDVKIAGEIVDAAGRGLKFKTPWCMASYISEQAERAVTGTVYVTDYASGRLIRAESAMFVRAVVDARTNERDYLAFRNLSEAVGAAKEHHSRVVDWPTLRRYVAAGKTAG